MAKNCKCSQPVGSSSAPSKEMERWEREYQARRQQSNFTEQLNTPFREADQMLTAGHYNCGEQMPPMPVRLHGPKKSS